jgi:hypothetical protein
LIWPITSIIRPLPSGENITNWRSTCEPPPSVTNVDLVGGNPGVERHTVQVAHLLGVGNHHGVQSLRTQTGQERRPLIGAHPGQPVHERVGIDPLSRRQRHVRLTVHHRYQVVGGLSQRLSVQPVQPLRLVQTRLDGTLVVAGLIGLVRVSGADLTGVGNGEPVFGSVIHLLQDE